MKNQNFTPFGWIRTKINIFWGEIKTKEEALKIIKVSSIIFYLVSIYQFVLGYLIIGAVAAIGDSIIFAILAFLLRKFNSKVAAIILFLDSLVILLTSRIEAVFPLFIVWFGIWAIRATFAVDKFNKIIKSNSLITD